MLMQRLPLFLYLVVVQNALQMKNLLLLLFVSLTISSNGQISSLPLFDIEDLQYEGAFRIKAMTFDSSSINYSQGPILYNPDNHSLFIVGHPYQQAIAEFPIPEIIDAESIADLNMSEEPIQGFFPVIPGGNVANPEGLDEIGGMMFFDGDNGKELLVNCYEYYDAPANNTLSTLVVKSPESLATTEISGFYKVEGEAGHTCRWYSPIPTELQSALAGTDITGSASGLPITSRLPVGPSAFAFDPQSYVNAQIFDLIPAEKLLDYSLSDPMYDDSYANYGGTVSWLFNDSLDNTIWTHVSDAVFGMIIPGTRTYLTIGRSGGHEYGVCYKCVQDNGNLCGGYCTYVAADNHHYFWSFDVLDLIAAKNGEIEPHDIRPYDYGIINIPFVDNGLASLGGGTFDEESGTMYLSLNKGDLEQGTYARPPLILTYTFDVEAPVAIKNDVENRAKLNIYPNPSSTGQIQILLAKASEEKSTLSLYTADMQLVKQHVLEIGTNKASLNLQQIPAGLYFLHLRTNHGVTLEKLVIQH